MADLDPGQRVAVLDRAEMAVLQVLAGLALDADLELTDDGAAAAARLERAGALTEGRLVAWREELLTPVVAPVSRAVCELHEDGAHSIVALVWQDAERTTVGVLIADGRTELSPSGPEWLASTIAAAVSLRDARAPADRRPISGSTLEVADAATGPLPTPLGELLGARKRSWRLTVTTATGIESLGVLDCGAAGLWRTEPDADTAARVRFVPMTFAQTMASLQARLAAPSHE